MENFQFLFIINRNGNKRRGVFGNDGENKSIHQIILIKNRCLIIEL